jgi:hypothetical protein
MNDRQRIIEIQDITNTISPTFCLAKWHHTTIYLQTGETHSCYHPAPHKIPLHELAHNPGALHNTQQKISERKEMIDGGKPAGCQYCWNIEALGSGYISDRQERNSTIYTPQRFEDIKQAPLANVNPQYIEISFGNECNFKCGYCHPKASSAYYKEIEKFGPYTMVKNHRNDIDWLTMYEEETNPYVKAWWEWWPEVKNTLTILRVTGGEPLLQQSTWRLLDDLEINPLPDLELNINSNLGVKPILIDRLAAKIKTLKEKKCIKSFQLFTSVDSWGPQAEYIRTGLDLTIWERNLDKLITVAQIPISLMITFNILSVPNFKQLLEKILEWRIKYEYYKDPGQERFRNIRFDTPYLKEPLQYDINILPKEEFMGYMQDNLKFIEDNLVDLDKTKFGELEFEKFKRLVRYMETTEYAPERVIEGRKDFYAWFTEYDRRRGTNFKATFPELIEFYNRCKDE